MQRSSAQSRCPSHAAAEEQQEEPEASEMRCRNTASTQAGGHLPITLVLMLRGYTDIRVEFVVVVAW
jgi:hypothetical protein